jgi:signal transduction histidine kinase
MTGPDRGEAAGTGGPQDPAGAAPSARPVAAEPPAGVNAAGGLTGEAASAGRGGHPGTPWPAGAAGAGAAGGGYRPAVAGARASPTSAQGPRAVRVASGLPDWAGSIRFRLTALYSVVLFGLAAVVVGGIYLVVVMRLHDNPVSRDYGGSVIVVQRDPTGALVLGQGRQVTVKTIEAQANGRAAQLLRTYSFAALGLLFVSSLVIGWIIAGRVLAPIGRITAVAREIQATDLSRRIALQGPPDELKNLADTFDSMLTRIDEAFASQRRFIHEASHELRNPLAVVRTNLEVTLADPEASVEDLRRTAEVVQRSAERMSHLVDDLLAYARQAAPERHFEAIDVADVVHEVAAEFTASAAARDLTISAKGDPGLWIVGDRVALRQAFDNLTANAVRLAPEGSTLRLVTGRREGWIWAAVADEGPGIPEADREMVFQRFWRGDGRRAREEGRSGLGLSIVRQIAEGHRGEIRLCPNDLGGTTFTIWLPAGPPPDGSAAYGLPE